MEPPDETLLSSFACPSFPTQDCSVSTGTRKQCRNRKRQTMMMVSTFLHILLLPAIVVDSFPLVSHKHVRHSIPLFLSSSMFEYEYIPNEGGSHDFQTNLPSVYPDGTPAGMRGEAVRAALRSTQCLGWKLAAQDSPNLASGLLKLQGRGVLDFLNNKLSNSFQTTAGASNANFAQACLLTSKGRLVDTLAIGHTDTDAFVMPSPGHPGAALFQKLDPFIFPMDQVQLTDLSETSCIFTLASTEIKHVQDAVEEHLLAKLREILPTVTGFDNFVLPTKKQSAAMTLSLTEESTAKDGCLVVLPHTGLPNCALVGYTFAFCGNVQDAGNLVWQHLTADDNTKGPVEIKGLEYESLRIEAGQPAFGFEVTGAWKEPEITSPTPLELHQKAGVIDVEKGCYLGQEGIASVLKNPRGPPRSLYSVTFQDDDNMYEHQSKGSKSAAENLTKLPKAGDKIYVLGSNEQIQVGAITSVAEPYSTGDTTIVALALVRRADSILKQMKAMDLQITRGIANKLSPMTSLTDTAESASASSGILPPPPIDSLDGLEIIVGGTFTVGMLRGVPKRKLPRGKNMYVDQEQDFLAEEDMVDQGFIDIDFSGMSPSEFLDGEAAQLERLAENKDTYDGGHGVEQREPAELDATEKEDPDDEGEAKRKAAKMEVLKQRAEEAMTRRREKKREAEREKEAAQTEATEDQAAAEEKRKAEKLMLLQQRAQEAISRRRKKRDAKQD